MNDGGLSSRYKIVLLGNSGCGKTSLITRWVFDTFDSSTKPTIGGNTQLKRMVVKNEEIDLFIWDTAGQEQFQSLTPLYIRNSTVVVITTSITDQDSFTAVPRWIDLVVNTCDEIPPMILAINKMDDIENSTMNVEEIDNMYTNKFKTLFYVSALTGENTDNLLKSVAITAHDFAQKKRFIEKQKLVAKEKSDSCC